MTFSSKFKQQLANPFVRNVGWLGTAELVNRVFRLGTTVTLARLFSPYDYGLIAIIYTIQSFAEVFTSGIGIGSKIVQVNEHKLEATCKTAYYITWMLCGTVFLFQCGAAFPIAWFYKNNQLILPICALSLKYLIIPFYKVQGALIKRENRLKIQAFCNSIESMLCNLITIGLAFIGMKIWAVVWAMVLSSLVRIVVYCLHHPWRPPNSIYLEEWREVSSFGIKILGIRLLERLRLHLDYLIVGSYLGVEALGIYFFAFNAGIGISQNIINAFMTSLFPHLCAVDENLQLKKRYFDSLRITAMVVVPLVLLQTIFAPLYVPIVFGAKWVSAIPILVIICLSAIPLSLALSTYQLLNAVGKAQLTLYWNAVYTLIFSFSLLIAVRWGVLSVAVTVLICQSLTIMFVFWATKSVFSDLPSRSVKSGSSYSCSSDNTVKRIDKNRD